MQGSPNQPQPGRRWPVLPALILGLLVGGAALDSAAHAPPSVVPGSLPSLQDVEGLPSAPARSTDPADALAPASAEPPGAALADPVATARIKQDFGRLPMHFEPNVGQSAEEVRYLARGAGYSLFLTDTEAVLVLQPGRATALADHAGDQPPDVKASYPSSGTGAEPPVEHPHPDSNRPPWPHRGFEPGRAVGASGAGRLHPEHANRTDAQGQGDPPGVTPVRMRLEGATRNPAPRITGLERRPGISNYYLGKDPAKWHSGVPHYAKVQYDQVYPGIDLVFYGNPRELEYDLVVAPGADPSQIRLAFEGADALRIDAEGNLVLAVAGGEILHRAPRIYQRVDGRERAVAGHYVLLEGDPADGAAGTDVVGMADAGTVSAVGFVLAAYDPAEPLVIDPVVVYSTYLGGSSFELGYGIAVDGASNAYVTGTTYSTDFPVVNARYTELRGEQDAFVTKLDAGGQGPVYSTYLGGSQIDNGYGIAVDSVGNAYVTGATRSADFPTVNARYPLLSHVEDAFVTKLDAEGQGPVYSTYLGGSLFDWGTGIAVDGASNAYVTGTTYATDFPVVNARYPGLRGEGDAFVTKLDAGGQGPVYSTYLGGSRADAGNGIAVDSVGNAYVTGWTGSADFPTVNACYSHLRGYADAFVTKLDAEGQGPVYSTYLGGSLMDLGGGIAVDGASNAYVTGQTYSADFPVFNALYPLLSGAADAFVTKLDAGGQGPVYSTYLGGTDRWLYGDRQGERGEGIAVDSAGNAYVTGVTYSVDFPAVNACYSQLRGYADAFVTKLDAGGQGPVYSTYLGGSEGEQISGESGYGIAVDGAGNAYVTGRTKAGDFPTDNARYPQLSGRDDAFVTKIDSSDIVNLTVTRTGNGTVNSTPSGIACGWDCAKAYPAGTRVILTATAAAGSRFAGWGNACTGTAATCTLVLSSSTRVTVTFNPPTLSRAFSVGLYRPDSSTFFLLYAHSGGPANVTFRFGPAGRGWLPLTGDWNGDGRTTVGLYNPAAGTFYLRNTHGGGVADATFAFGSGGHGWLPLTGDWDGDGRTTVGLYNPSTGTFYLRNANAGGPANVTFGFGPAGRGWLPLTGDWDGDGRTTVGLYDPSAGTFYLRNANAGGSADMAFAFGPRGRGWLPLTGDWDGDGPTTVGLYNPSTGTFYLRNANAGGSANVTFGFGPAGAGWTPLTGDWVR
ncbi:SBBP repeat-containing protein [Thiocapsa rosea]|uniref:Beta-propeller repeat-containing protein n=1 Tax=Thiocapsa rosea TaxID=69360 RepID=A0A495V4W3_9GAMM|nr:SBBP repeat-containing protein [Thiocapsa rosea]RKT44452.1 beta-propeller repeat-containing protein [Thiocapsa rosea]